MDITEIIPAGQMGVIPGGNFIYCISASHADFEIQPMGGEKAAFHIGAEESFSTAPEEFRVWNNGADLVAKFRIKNDGEYRDNRLTLNGNINANVLNFPATFSDGLTEITRHGYGQIGASYASGTGTGVAITVVAPVTNAAGIILRTAHVVASASQISLYADTAAPISATDATKRRLLTAWVSGQNPQLEDRYLAPGNGIYIFGGVSAEYSLTFDIL